MPQITIPGGYVTVAQAAALLGTSVAVVSELVDTNEVESLTLIPTTAIRSRMVAAGEQP